MRGIHIIISFLLLAFSQGLMAQGKITLPLEERISLFPNPITDGVLNIEIDEENTGSLEIYDFLGSKVFSVELDIPTVHKYRFYLSDLNSGKYFVRINIEKEVVTKKISIM